MKSLAALMSITFAMAAGAAAGQTLIVHYSERAGIHYTNQQGQLAGDAAKPVTEALTAAGIAYEIRRTPAKRQLVLLKENREPACMMSWVDMPGRDNKGKFSDVISRGEYERRLWCSKMVPDDVIKRFNAALAAQAK
ncbi:hypothetical protein NHH88_31085 [Oxalobacteraceae bacterium OTU3CAMAD1]|nr:hypothetical protein NHH88_31085 [Oxalobacteraceae bacterium OTU3CAMAD1]